MILTNREFSKRYRNRSYYEEKYEVYVLITIIHLGRLQIYQIKGLLLGGNDLPRKAQSERPLHSCVHSWVLARSEGLTRCALLPSEHDASDEAGVLAVDVENSTILIGITVAADKSLGVDVEDWAGIWVAVGAGAVVGSQCAGGIKVLVDGCGWCDRVCGAVVELATGGSGRSKAILSIGGGQVGLAGCGSIDGLDVGRGRQPDVAGIEDGGCSVSPSLWSVEANSKVTLLDAVIVDGASVLGGLERGKLQAQHGIVLAEDTGDRASVATIAVGAGDNDRSPRGRAGADRSGRNSA